MQIETEADIPDQFGRLALVTGATGGLGFETARMLADAGADVILTGRNSEKGATALAKLATRQPRGRLSFEILDLADLSQLATGAERIAATHPQLDLLINNAGVMAPRARQTTADGFELQFGTNHLGHFALTGHLLPLLRNTPNARVVTVSSLAARFGRIDFADLQQERRYNAMAAYGQAKLANLLFSYQLQNLSDRYGWNITATSAHPGWAATNLVSNGPGEINGLAGWLEKIFTPYVAISASEGALPTICAALCDDLEPDAFIGPGRWFELRNPPGNAIRTAKSRKAETAARLWDVSEALTGVHYPQEP